MRIFNKIRNKVEVIKRAVDEQSYWDSLARQVSPAVIEEFPEYILIDNRLMARTLLIGIPPTSDISGYPADMNPKIVDELLGISAEGHSIAFSYTVIPISNVDSMKMLDEAIFKNKVAQESFRDKPRDGQIYDKTKQPPLKKIYEEEDFAANYKEIYKNQQKMHHTAFIVVIWGKDRDSIREAESHVRIILESNRIYYEMPDYRHLDTFLASQPYPVFLKYSWIELFSYHTATLIATRNPNSRTDDTGLYFGDDLKTGKNVQIDLRTLAAQHLMFVGPTGSGKTFTLLMLLMRSFDMLGKRIIYTTPKADVTTNYRNVAEYYGTAASIIDIGPRGKNINPLQILFDETILKDEIDYQHAFDEHMELLDQFFAVLFEGTKTINMSNYLNESLMQVYRSKGIRRDDPKTWRNANWPTLIDLRSIWLAAASDNSADVTAKALIDKTYMVNTAWSYMNRPTDINTSADFIIVDISGVPESIKDAMNVFVTGIMGMRFKTDTKKETIIAVDEAAVFLRNPKLSLFLLRTLTQGRSYNISLWLATQQTADLVKANLEDEFKTNVSISIILGNMRKDTLDHVTKFYNLDEHSVADLQACGVGEGLLIVGDEIIPTRFKPTDLETSVIKGKKVVENTSMVDTIELIDDSIKEYVTEHKICFSSWLKSDPNQLVKKGFTPYRVQNALGIGPTQVWTKQIAGNQTIDHYATVYQLAGYLKIQKIPVEIHHSEDVDIVAEINGKQIAFEYERPGIHTFDQLIKKKEFAQNKYDRVVFIGQTANIKFLTETVGEKNTVKRGIELLELLSELINEK
jgi:hypothetical protein